MEYALNCERSCKEREDALCAFLESSTEPSIFPQSMAPPTLCAKIGESESSVALAWLLSNPAVTASIIGRRALKQFEDSFRAVEIELSEDVL